MDEWMNMDSYLQKWWAGNWDWETILIYKNQWKQLNIIKSLTGLPDDNAVGYGSAVLVVSRTLVRPLVGLGLFPADVNNQSPWAGLHQNFGVFLYVEVGPISRPGKARINKNNNYHCFLG